MMRQRMQSFMFKTVAETKMNYCIATLLLLNSLAAAQESSALSLKTRITLSNVKGRMDHLGVDLKGQRLFSTAIDNHTLEVIDVQAGRQVHTIADLNNPQSAFYDASTNRLFVPCGGGRNHISASANRETVGRCR